MKSPMYPFLVATLMFSSAAFANEKADVMALGQQKYLVCAACHGVDGKGMQPAPGMTMAPNLLESKILEEASAETITAILMRGIKKENPAEYMGQMMMPLGASMTDEDVAAIVTYVRNSFAGKDEVVTAEQVAEWREKYPPSEGQMERSKILEMVGISEEE